jgi:hypothetical protein
MLKSCENCSHNNNRNEWECVFKTKKPEKNICHLHSFKCCGCNGHGSDYLFKEKYFCCACLLEELGVQEGPANHYYLQGRYIGTEDDIEDVIPNLDDGIESLDDLYD